MIADAIVRHAENCGITHVMYRTFMLCAVRNARWVDGEGPFALITWCHVPSVTLWQTLGEATKEKRRIDRTGCGHGCYREHEIGRLPRLDRQQTK